MVVQASRAAPVPAVSCPALPAPAMPGPACPPRPCLPCALWQLEWLAVD